jgi:hypothetical protein
MVPTQNLPDKTEENHEKIQLVETASGSWESNPKPPEFEKGVLTIQLWHSAHNFIQFLYF